MSTKTPTSLEQATLDLLMDTTITDEERDDTLDAMLDSLSRGLRTFFP